MTFRAVVLEMDRVLTDSESAFYAAIKDVLGQFGKHIGVEDYSTHIGSATEAAWGVMIERFALATPLETEPDPELMRGRAFAQQHRAKLDPTAVRIEHGEDSRPRRASASVAKGA